MKRCCVSALALMLELLCLAGSAALGAAASHRRALAAERSYTAARELIATQIRCGENTENTLHAFSGGTRRSTEHTLTSQQLLVSADRPHADLLVNHVNPPQTEHTQRETHTHRDTHTPRKRDTHTHTHRERETHTQERETHTQR